MLSLQIRTLHAYIGMLIAPALIFFAATGLLQIYGLHEAHPGYTPPALLEKLSAVHKDQHFVAGGHEHGDDEHMHSGAPDSGPLHGGPHGDEHEEGNFATALLKAFFAAVATGLIFSSCAGVWLALQRRQRRGVYIGLLLIGALVPLVLAAMAT